MAVSLAGSVVVEHRELSVAEYEVRIELLTEDERTNLIELVLTFDPIHLCFSAN